MITVNSVSLVATPAGDVTTMLPVVATDGTVAVIKASLTSVNDAVTPLNATRFVSLKWFPTMLTTVPTGPRIGLKLVMTGGNNSTLKSEVLVAVPADVVTVMRPVVAPFGTMVEICVSLPMVNVAVVPLNLTAVVPVKLIPVIVTPVPTAPAIGVKLRMTGR